MINHPALFGYSFSGPPSCMLILTRDNLRSLISMRDCILAVEAAFRLTAHGEAIVPGAVADATCPTRRVCCSKCRRI